MATLYTRVEFAMFCNRSLIALQRRRQVRWSVRWRASLNMPPSTAWNMHVSNYPIQFKVIVHSHRPGASSFNFRSNKNILELDWDDIIFLIYSLNKIAPPSCAISNFILFHSIVWSDHFYCDINDEINIFPFLSLSPVTTLLCPRRNYGNGWGWWLMRFFKLIKHNFPLVNNEEQTIRGWQLMEANWWKQSNQDSH